MRWCTWVPRRSRWRTGSPSRWPTTAVTGGLIPERRAGGQRRQGERGERRRDWALGAHLYSSMRWASPHQDSSAASRIASSSRGAHMHGRDARTRRVLWSVATCVREGTQGGLASVLAMMTADGARAISRAEACDAART